MSQSTTTNTGTGNSNTGNGNENNNFSIMDIQWIEDEQQKLQTELDKCIALRENGFNENYELEFEGSELHMKICTDIEHIQILMNEYDKLLCYKKARIEKEAECTKRMPELQMEFDEIVNSNGWKIDKLYALYQKGLSENYGVAFISSELRLTISTLIEIHHRTYMGICTGTYFATIDNVWKGEWKSFHNFESFVRKENVYIVNSKQYVDTVKEAKKERNVIASNYQYRRYSFCADSFCAETDIFGVKSVYAEPTHLIPHSKKVADYWFPFVSLVLYTGNEKWADSTEASWMFLQKCIHGSNKQAEEETNTSEVPNVGIKHFPTNQIQLCSCLGYFERNPFVIIVPILTVDQVVHWSGGGYNAIVLAGDVNGTSEDDHRVYHEIAARGTLLDKENFGDCLAHIDEWLANENECEMARYLLEQMIFCVCKSFNDCTFIQDFLYENKRYEEWNSAIAQLNNGTVPVPISMSWTDKLKIRKVSFSNSTEDNNPAPDPTLLLARATSTWLRRQNIPLLPVCNEEDEYSYEFSNSDDSSYLSWCDEVTVQGWTPCYPTEKKICIEEVNFTMKSDTIDEDFSDDESLLE
jgi:hypothetical protein